MTQTYKVQVSMNQAHIVESGFVWKQGDFGFNIEIEVLDFDTTGATPQIIFRKSNGAVEATDVTRAGNKFTYVIRGTELDTPGPCVCDLKLNDSTTKRVSTASFKYFVIPDTMDGLEQEASSYSDTIEQIVGGFQSQIDGLESTSNIINTNIFSIIGMDNLIEWDPDSDGKYIDPNGQVGNLPESHYSEYLPIVPGTYSYSFEQNTPQTKNHRIHGYNASKVWQQQITYVSTQVGTTITFTIPDSIKYIRVSAPTKATDSRITKSQTIIDDLADKSVVNRGTLTSADDLHDISLPGMYYVDGISIPTNFPYNGAGRVFVNKSPSSKSAESHFIVGSSGLWVERYQGGGAWTPWMKLSDQSSAISTLSNNLTDLDDRSIAYHGQLRSSDDMHNLSKPGMYYVSYNEGGNPANFPYDNRGTCRVLVNKSSSASNHIGETHFVMGETGLWVERYAGSSWTSWMKLSDQSSAISTVSNNLTDLDDRSIAYHGQLRSSDDMHNLSKPGMYYVSYLEGGNPANFPYDNRGTCRVLVNKSSSTTSHAGETHFVMGETGLWVERYAGSSWTPWYKLSQESDVEKEAKLLNLHTIPANMGVVNAIKRARQLADIVWTPSDTIMRGFYETGDTYINSHGDKYLGTFAEGVEYTGLPYTETQYIGFDAVIDSFATGVCNENSAEIVNSQDPQALTNKPSYYGTNCVGFVSYSLDIPLAASNVYQTIRYMTDLGYLNDNGTVFPPESLKLCDVLWHSSHVAIITDIYKDSNGSVTYIETSESTRQGNPLRDVLDGQEGGKCRRFVTSTKEFYSWFDGFKVLRYQNLDKVKYVPNKYSPMVDEAKPLAYKELPCMPFEGNMRSYSYNGSRQVTVLINSSYYTHLRVLKDGALFNEYEIGNNTQIVVTCPQEEAQYNACLVRYSGEELQGISVSCQWYIRPLINPTRSISNNVLTLSLRNFRADSFKPLFVTYSATSSETQAEKALFYLLFDEDLTVTDNGDGTVDYTFSVPYTDTSKAWVNVGIKNHLYGVAAARFTLPTA